MGWWWRWWWWWRMGMNTGAVGQGWWTEVKEGVTLSGKYGAWEWQPRVTPQGVRRAGKPQVRNGTRAPGTECATPPPGANTRATSGSLPKPSPSPPRRSPLAPACIMLARA